MYENDMKKKVEIKKNRYLIHSECKKRNSAYLDNKKRVICNKRKNTEMATDDSMYVKYVNKYARNVYYAGVGMYFLFR